MTDRDGNVVMFADDTTLISRGLKVDLAQAEADRHLNEASAWFEANGLQLNDDKTQALICSLARDTPNNEPVKLL
jgi:hypothetical protein